MTAITILDGGMGREIKQRITQWDPILWSASGLIYDPQLVCDIHREFIEAGAQIIKTNNYTVVPYALRPAKRIHEFESLTVLSGKIAQEAKKKASVNAVKVAGSLPPLSPTYRPDLVEHDDKQSVDMYKKIIQWLDPYVDLFIVESLSSITEFYQVSMACAITNKPVYVSFLLDEETPGQLLDGTTIHDLVPIVEAHTVEALLFNCSHPETISKTVQCIQNDRIQLGAYANAFFPIVETFNHGDLRTSDESVTPTVYLDHVQQWLDHGVTLVGGCCGIGPDHIRAIANYLNQ